MPTELSTECELLKQASRQDGTAGPLLYARIEGEINLHNSPGLRTDLLRLVNQERPHNVVLNLSQVPYMDSSAIAVIVEVLKLLRAEGGAVHLTQLQKRVAGLLRIARLDTIFVLNDTDEAALREAGQAPGAD